MFFMIGILPFQKQLRTLFLRDGNGQLQEAQIWQTGSRLVIFFIPLFSFGTSFIVRFPDGTVLPLNGLDKEQIMDADRMQIEDHIQYPKGPQERFCPSCGRKLDDDFAFCPYCGNRC